MMEESDRSNVFVPDTILNEAATAVEKVIPQKSKSFYEKEYQLFCDWRNKKNARGVDENIILAYISQRSKDVKGSSLWSYHSQLKKMIMVKENVDIGRFHQVKAFLKQHSVGHRPKKSRVFIREDLEKFLDIAPDDKYLLIKVVFIMGVAGGCRLGELVSMSIDHVEDRGNVLIVKIPDTKTYKERIFTVVDGNNSVHAIDIFCKYRKLRPASVPHKRLFLNYKNQKCTVQPVGINTFSKMPQVIAKFLGFNNAEEYTGHSFRRSSATLLANAGADLSVLKRHGGWQSNSVAEGYIEDSIANKIDISKKILGGGHAEEFVMTNAKLLPSTSHSYDSTSNSLEVNVVDGDNNSTNNIAGKMLSKVVQFNNLTNCNFYFNKNNE